MRILLASAALVSIAFASPQALAQAQTQIGNAPFCLKQAAGTLNCRYQTMVECDDARGGNVADVCIPRMGGTTGLGNEPPEGAGTSPRTDEIPRR